MIRRPSIFAINLVALSVTLMGLPLAAAYLMQPDSAFPHRWADFVPFVSQDPKAWLLILALFCGTLAASIQREGDYTAWVIAALCAVAGSGLALHEWLRAEIFFATADEWTRSAFHTGKPHVTFVGQAYFGALCYAALGLAGSAATLAILRLRRHATRSGLRSQSGLSPPSAP